MHGSVVRSWLLELTARALAENPDLAGLEGYVEDSGEGRWTLHEGDRQGRSVARPDRGPVHALPFPRRPTRSRTACWPRSATSSADTPSRSAMPDVTLVIFGGAGDLSHRKLLPALYNLHLDGLLPPRTSIVGVGRQPMTDEQYREFAKDGVATLLATAGRRAAWGVFAESLFFVSGSLEDPATFAALGSRLDIIEHERGLPGNRIYYLAVPPPVFVPTVEQLARARFVAPPSAGPFSRLIVEKPIGHDLASAQAINDAIAKVFDERQIYPHRSLPGKGDRPEHPRPSFRQQHLRAVVQPEVRRPRADHRRGRGRRRHARRRTTSRLARCGTWSRTTCCSSWR